MIHLRELCFEDLKEINSWRNNPKVIADLVAPFRYINPETDNKWFDHYMQNRSTNVRCTIYSDENPNNVIGSIGLTDMDFVSRKASYYVQIGEENNQGKGIGYEATKQILEHAFLNLNLNRVELRVLENNQRAIHLYEKVGFQMEGVQRQAVFKNGSYINSVYMAILKEDFMRNRES